MLLLLFMKRQSFLQNTTTFFQHLFQAEHKKYCWAPGSNISDSSLWQHGEWLHKKKVLSQLIRYTVNTKDQVVNNVPVSPKWFFFLVALTIKHWYIWKFLPVSIWLYLNENKHLSLCLKVSIIQPDYSASLVGMSMSKNPSLFVCLCDPCPVSNNKGSVCFHRSTQPWLCWYRSQHSRGHQICLTESLKAEQALLTPSWR